MSTILSKALWATVFMLYVLIMAFLFYHFWDFIVADAGNAGSDKRPNSYNFVVAVVAAVGLPFVFWRGLTAHRQAETAERGLRNDRYQKGADMLGGETLTARLGGVHALERLGRDFPEEYHIQVLDLFSDFMQLSEEVLSLDRPTYGAEPSLTDNRCRPDVEAVARAIGNRNNRQIGIENRLRKRFHAGRFDLIDISGVNLRGANLASANLSDANLRNADLTQAHLQGATMSGDILEDADLSKAVLADADLKLAQAQKAKFADAVLSTADLNKANLTGADLTNADLLQANLRNASLTKAKLIRASLIGTNLKGADLSRANLNGADLNGADLNEADLNEADLSGADLTGANLLRADLKGATLKGATLVDTTLVDADLRGADLSEANLKGARLHNATLCETTGLTQEMLDSADTNTESTPILGELYCAETGRQLEWRPVFVH